MFCWFFVLLSVVSRSGGGLLFRGLSLSIMGAGAFHGRVRDGIGCRHSALEPPDRLKTGIRDRDQVSGIRMRRGVDGARNFDT